MADTRGSPSSPTPSQLPPIPASPTFSYASTANPISQYHLPPPLPPRPAHAVLTKADLENSQTAYSDLISSAKTYRVALAALSTAASSFGSALESCARLKEARADALGPAAGASLSNSFNTKGSCTADALMTVAGLQHLVANHHHILSETVYRSFEVPLLHEMDKWRAAVEDEEESYARAVAVQSKEIRRLEKEGLKLHRQRRRDVSKFRSHLVELTTKLDGLTALHGEHARTLLRESQETSVRIVDASCSLVRAEVDIFESLARKGWTGGGLEDVLEKGTDLFASEESVGGAGVYGGGGKGGNGVGDAGGVVGGGSGEGSKLFSILPPKSILADSGPDTIRVGKHHRTDNRYQSLTGAVSDPGGATSTAAAAGAASRERDRDTDSVFSEFNRSRGVRPFSPQPQPLRLNPEGLLGSLDDYVGGGEISPSDETSQLLTGGGGAGSPLVLQQKSRTDGLEGGRDADTDDEGRAVYDADNDDDEAHPWRDEQGLRHRSAGTAYVWKGNERRQWLDCGDERCR
ncbi:hypothetical protein B0H66DRAFT_572875 [Apodospora peruviana]|uniref:Protein IVY1 n=1 Tax=Apodospora peruviana TaxID=516989 RepID=A0AAE0MG73_9PEZI|nr:hypothetical protein B0H66DRAFT_572875 [Apodospora peruviana]